MAMPRVAFAIAAHPDDIEFVMSGTMMLLSRQGFELHYLNIANGCCGSSVTDGPTTAQIRREESLRAAQFLGATFHESLTNDLEIFYEHRLLIRLASIIREVTPEILLVHSPDDYMEDHMNACRLALTAAFARGMPNYPVDPPRPAISQDITVYHAQPHGNHDGLRRAVIPEFYVNVSDVIEQKAHMLSLHESQKRWLDESQGMNSYLQSMKDLCRDVGTMSSVFPYAEGWRRRSHLGYGTEHADPLREVLGDDVCHTRPT